MSEGTRMSVDTAQIYATPTFTCKQKRAYLCMSNPTSYGLLPYLESEKQDKSQACWRIR